jgi:hypothetical protein
MTNTYRKCLFFAIVILLSIPCFSKQKHHRRKKETNKNMVDTTKGMTREQRATMLKHTLDEKMYYYHRYLDTAKNKK